jgi:hypothetical protein
MIDMLNKLLISVFAFAIIFGISTPSALGCGCMNEDFFMVYWQFEPDDMDAKENFIKTAASIHGLNYDPEVADKLLLKVLLDGARKGVNLNIIKGTLVQYNCVFHSRNLPEYRQLLELLPPAFATKICTDKKYKNTFMVISDNGAVIRSRPSKQSRRVNSIPDGQLVELKEINGEWMNVSSHWGEGYIHSSLLKKY